MQEQWGRWQDGTGSRYSARVGQVLYYDQGQYHGRAQVQIKDNVTGHVIDRVGDVKIVGNFSPIWVSLLGRKVLLETLLGWNGPVEEELDRMDRAERMKKHGLEKSMGPQDWLPSGRKKQHGRLKGSSMGATFGVGPFDSEGASSFLGYVTGEMMHTVSQLLSPDAVYSNEEIIAAAALLHHLSNDTLPDGTEGPVNVRANARFVGLYEMAVEALDLVLADRAWFASTPEPARKRAAVGALRDELRKIAAEDPEREDGN